MLELVVGAVRDGLLSVVGLLVAVRLVKSITLLLGLDVMVDSVTIVVFVVFVVVAVPFMRTSRLMDRVVS